MTAGVFPAGGNAFGGACVDGAGRTGKATGKGVFTVGLGAAEAGVVGVGIGVGVGPEPAG